MEITLSNETALWFDIYAEASHANSHMSDSVEKLDRTQLQAVTTAIFIQTNMNRPKDYIKPYKDSQEPGAFPQKDGYPESMPTERNWDGTERVTGGKHFDKDKKIGKQYSDLPYDYLAYMADRNDPKYPNKAQFELDRRTSEDIDEDENLPF